MTFVEKEFYVIKDNSLAKILIKFDRERKSRNIQIKKIELIISIYRLRVERIRIMFVIDYFNLKRNEKRVDDYYITHFSKQILHI